MYRSLLLYVFSGICAGGIALASGSVLTLSQRHPGDQLMDTELGTLTGGYSIAGHCDYSNQRCTALGWLAQANCQTRPADQSWPHDGDDLFPGTYCVLVQPTIMNRCGINTLFTEFNETCLNGGGPGCRLRDSMDVDPSLYCAIREDWYCLTQTVLVNGVRTAVCNCVNTGAPYATSFGFKICDERPQQGN
jgi:hypothetical protein